MSRETTIYEDLAAILLQFTKDVKEGSIATVPVEGEDLKVTNVIDASPQAIAFLQAEHMKLQVFFLFLLLGDAFHANGSVVKPFGGVASPKLPTVWRGSRFSDFPSTRKGPSWKRGKPKPQVRLPFDEDMPDIQQTGPILKETNNTNVCLHGSFVCFAYNIYNNALFG